MMDMVFQISGFKFQGPIKSSSEDTWNLKFGIWNSLNLELETWNYFPIFAAQNALSSRCKPGRKVWATQGILLLNRKAGESLQ